MNPDLIHHGFQWRLGKNVDTEPFSPQDTCQAGGLYFTTSKLLLNFFPIDEDMVKLLDHWLALVTVDDDEEVWSEHDLKWKAKKVTVVSLTKIGDIDIVDRIGMLSDISMDTITMENLLKSFVTCEALALAMIEPELETKELVMMALSSNYSTLQFVANQTFKICCYAAAIDDNSVIFIRDEYMREIVEQWITDTPPQTKK